MRRLVLISVLLLSGCGDKQQVDQVSQGNNSPNVVGDHAQIQYVQNFYGANAEEVKRLQDELKLTKEQAEALLKQLTDKDIALESRTGEFENLARKYADLEQRLGEYAKTDELAQQARKALEIGDLEKAETLLQEAYDKDLEVSRQRLAQRAFDLAEVAELRFEHDKALAKYQEVTELQPDNLQAWKSLFEIASKVGSNKLALEAARGLQRNLQPADEDWLSIALTDEGIVLEKLGDRRTAMEKYLAALTIDKQRVTKNPDDPNKQRDLSVSYNKLGAIYEANGDRVLALKSYEDSLAIRRKLVEMDPNNVQWQTDIVVSYVKLSGVEPAKKQTYLREALKTLQKLDSKNYLSVEQQGWIAIIESELEG